MNRVVQPAVLLLICLALAGCGADGEPVRPSANLDVGVSSSGVHTGASVGLRKGSWNLSWGRYL